jgi:hypothetical protein
MDNKQTVRSSLDPHGYVPCLIDERLLTPAQRQEALLAMLEVDPTGDDRNRNWMGQLTSAERRELKALQPLEPPDMISRRQSFAAREKRVGLATLGLLRGYARRKFSQGHPIAYGDSLLRRLPCG